MTRIDLSTLVGSGGSSSQTVVIKPNQVGADDTDYIVGLLATIPRASTPYGCDVLFKAGSYNIRPNSVLFEVSATNIYFEAGCTFTCPTAAAGDKILWVGNSNINIYGQVAISGSGARGNGIAVAMGPTTSTRVPASGVTNSGVHSCFVSGITVTNCEAGIDFGISDPSPPAASDPGNSSGDNTLLDFRASNCQDGVRSRGFVNNVYGAFIDSCDYGLHQTTARTSGRLIAQNVTINNCYEAPISVEYGSGSTFRDIWIEQTSRRANQAAVAVIGNSGSGASVRFEGVTNGHVADTPEDYLFKMIGKSYLHVDEIAMSASTGDAPGIAVVGQMSTHSGQVTIDKIAYKVVTVPANWNSNLLVDKQAGATGTVVIRRVPEVTGSPIGAYAGPLVGGAADYIATKTSLNSYVIGERNGNIIYVGTSLATAVGKVPANKTVHYLHTDFKAQTWASGVIAYSDTRELDVLADVDVSTVAPTDGQALAWKAASSLWIPQTIAGGGGGTAAAPSAPDYTITVTGSPNTATYKAIARDGSVASTATDSSTVSALRTVLNAIMASNIHIHFSTGRFHFLDAPLGSEAWANITGINITGLKGIRLSGEGIGATIVSCRSNTVAASPDLGIFLFTNCMDVDLHDMTVEFCGAYQATMEAVNCNQGNRFRVQRVKFNRSKSTVITMDGGDVGKSTRYDVIRDCIFEGRPNQVQADLLTSGGSGLTNGGSYSYAVAYRDLDGSYYTGATASVTGGVATVVLGAGDTCDYVAGEKVVLQGASVSAYNGQFTLLSATTTQFTFTLGGSPAAATGITVVGPGTTQPSDPSTPIVTTSGICSIKVWLGIGPYTTAQRVIYRYDGTQWKLVQTISDNTTLTWTDTGVAGTTTFAFGQRSNIPHSGIQLLASRGVIVQGNVVDGVGDTIISGASNQGIRLAQKQSVSCDRNIIAQNIIRNSGGAGIHCVGASDNIITANEVSNPGTIATKSQAIRLAASGGVNSLRNLVVNNRCYDDQTAGSPAGGPTTSPSMTIASGSDNNAILGNYVSGSVVTVAISDGAAGTVIDNNVGHNAKRITISTGAPPAATALYKDCWYLRTDLAGGTLYLCDGSAWTQVAAGVSATGGSGTVPTPVVIPLLVQNSSLSWAIPLAETEIAQSRSRGTVDLTNATDIRMAARVSAAAATGARLKLQYSLTGATWIDFVNVVVDTVTSAGVARGTWTPVPTAARADVFYKLMGDLGDGAATAALGNIVAQVR